MLIKDFRLLKNQGKTLILMLLAVAGRAFLCGWIYYDHFFIVYSFNDKL